MARTHARPPWLALLALTSALAGAQIVGSSRPTTTRVAIRVDCSEQAACARAEAIALDVWSEHRAPGMPLDVVVSSDELSQLTHYEVIDPDIDATARAEMERLRRPRAQQPADWFAEYRDYRAISDRMHELAASAPDRTSVHGVGSSIDSRTIWALRVGHGPTKMLINGTQHAREWIAAMATTCVAERLVRDYDKDPAIRAFVDTTELWIVPVVNPDGYQHSWASSRYWRKNRRGGYGVDLNRNWAVAWAERGASDNRYSDVYRGTAPFSEPESAALRDLAKRVGATLHIDFHAYGQMLIYPWSWSPKETPDHARFGAAGDRIASAVFAQHKHSYKLMQGVELYAASGTMTDWMYGDAHALSFTVELRPSWGGRGRGGFVLPPEQIRPTCDEALAAVLALRGAPR
jgi:hypothetical protein